jgi:hypothetical protein
MKTREMLEIIQQHHPHVNEAEAIKLINRAKDDFCERTEILKDTYTSTTVANQRYYDIDKRVIKINDIFLDDVKIARTLEKPDIDDGDSGEYV